MRRVPRLRTFDHSSDIVTAGTNGYTPTSQCSVAQGRFKRSRSSSRQAGSGLQDKPCPSRPGSALTIVVVGPAAVEQAEAADMLARQKLDGTMEAAKAVLADVIAAESTLQTALVQRGIVAGAQSLGSLVRVQYMVTCC